MRRNLKFLRKSECGFSMMETLLAIAVMAAIVPFAYYRLSETNREVIDVSLAHQILAYQDPLLNFVRLNNAIWEEEAMFRLTSDDINWINTEMGANVSSAAQPFVGFIDKYRAKGHVNIDIYLAFNLDGFDEVRTSRLARAIGADAGIVAGDGIAYGAFSNWAASSEDFVQGNLVLRAQVDLDDAGFQKYLHKVETDDDLNSMQRNLMLGGHDIFDTGAVFAKTAQIASIYTGLTSAQTINANEVYFQDGANLDPTNTRFGHLRVAGDVIGFKNIKTKKFTGGGTQWSTQGTVVADRTTVTGTVHVGKSLQLRPLYSHSVSGFAVIVTHTANVPLIVTDVLTFGSGMGLTVSGDLLFSGSDVPMRLGRWAFPSDVVAPSFTSLKLLKYSNVEISQATQSSAADFEKIMISGWKDLPVKGN